MGFRLQPKTEPGDLDDSPSTREGILTGEISGFSLWNEDLNIPGISCCCIVV